MDYTRISSETSHVKREWSKIYSILKGKSHKPGILYPVKLSLMSEGEIKVFQTKTNERIHQQRSTLEEMLKAVQRGKKCYRSGSQIYIT